MSSPRLRDPERCPRCQGRSYVVNSRRVVSVTVGTYRWRRHRCRNANCLTESGKRTVWRSYDSTINPTRISLKTR